jgi:hypothetical protein
MSLITDSDEYSPGMTNDGSYIDQIPSFKQHSQGLRCPCNNHVFHGRTNFATHIKSDRHKKWLEAQNANRNNHAVELEKALQLIKDHKLIIAKFEVDNARLEHNMLKMTEMIHILSDNNRKTPLTQKETTLDLLDF